MKETKIITEQKTIISDVITKEICNNCGKLNTYNQKSFSLLTNVFIDPSYGSAMDGDTYQADLCDTCLNQLIADYNFIKEE